MLKNLDPLLFPELLKVLCEMGHGDEVVLVDANFTAASLGIGKPVLRWPGVGMRRACEALLSVFPLDDFVERPVGFMQVGGSADGYRSALQREVLDDIARRSEATHAQCEAIERFAFYERARRAHAIVQTGELQAWANFVFKKGVLAEALRP